MTTPPDQSAVQDALASETPAEEQAGAAGGVSGARRGRRRKREPDAPAPATPPPDAGPDPESEAAPEDGADQEPPAGPPAAPAGSAYGDDPLGLSDAARDDVSGGPFADLPDGPLPLPTPALRPGLDAALLELREQIDAVRFVLEAADIEEARAQQVELRNQLDDYVLPRLRGTAAPLLVVLGGSTGAGKSTLVNTLVGSRVSATGVLRPTTSSPILVCHPDHRDYFLGTDVIPGMTPVPGPAPDAIAGDQLVIIASDALPEGLALLDSPDFDSVFEDHYEFATKLMDAADLWLCVTTAARYADAQVWEMLQRARRHGATIGTVLSRVPSGAGSEVVEHFTEMLAQHGVAEARRFSIPETRVEDSRLPESCVEEIRTWLLDLAENRELRIGTVDATLNGVLDSLRTRVPRLAGHVETQVELRRGLSGKVDAAYETALAELDEATRNGSLLRGEVLARWQDFAGTGDLLKALSVSKKKALSRSRRRTPARVRALKAALRAGLESLILASAEHGAEAGVTRWRDDPAGRDVLEAHTAGLEHASPELSRRVTRAVSAWQDHVLELIRTEGVTKRSVARVVSFDEEALSAVLMVGMLGYGLSEVNVESGVSALPQRLLKALFGAESLRGMGAKARADLRSRIGMLFDEEALRFGQALDAAGIPDETTAVQLYQATYNLEVAR